jgi:serine/threonine-protein kinase
LDLTPGLVVADRFRLERTLGQGGMGAVWVAQHVSLDTPCAVKFIHEESTTSTELRNRFEREAKAAAQLRSPHVVQILDHGVWEGRPYIAMELLEGEDLAKRLRRTRPLPSVVVAAIASQVGRALTKAHAAGLVHRDLKPANIFLVRDDDREIAKVLDFGVAKTTAVATTMTSDGDTKTGAMLGTPFYMSPEQARGNKDIDHRADLWALAVVVYQCVTGKLPYRSDALGDLLVKIITEPPPVPSSVATVPPGFDAWWKRASDHDITKRFQTAKELTDALALALEVTVPGPAEVGSSVAIPVPPGAPSSLDDPPASNSSEEGQLGSGPRTLGASTSGAALQPAGVPRKGSTSFVVALVGVALVLASLGAFAAFRSAPSQTTGPLPLPSAVPANASNAMPSAAPPSTAPSAPVVTVATAAAPSSASPARPAAHSPPAKAAPAAPAPAPPLPPLEPAPKPKVDFGI